MEARLEDGVFVTVESGEAAGGAGVPEFYEMVFGARNDETFGGVPVDGFDIPAVAGKSTLLDTFVEVPYFESAIVGSGDEFGVGGGK